MWKQALGYKKDIKNWNSRAPSAKDIPSGETDPVAWRHMKIRQRLFVERNPDKTEADMPSHFQPSIIWPAYVALQLINDHKFSVVDRDDDADPVKAGTKSRVQQREDSRPQKVPKVEKKQTTRMNTNNSIAQSVRFENRHQRNAEHLIVQKSCELQKSESTILFQSSLAMLVASKEGALDELPLAGKQALLQLAGEGAELALQCMEYMVRNPLHLLLNSPTLMMIVKYRSLIPQQLME